MLIVAKIEKRHNTIFMRVLTFRDVTDFLIQIQLISKPGGTPVWEVKAAEKFKYQKLRCYIQ